MARDTRIPVAAASIAGTVVIAVAGCGGGGSGGSTAATVNAASFCQDYTAAANAFQLTSGDVSDPNFATFLVLLTKAQAEAPAAVQSDVTAILDESKKISAESATGQSGSTDLTDRSTRVSNWADSNCSGTGAAATTTASSGSSTAAAGTRSVAAFCSDAGTIADELATLDQAAATGNPGDPGVPTTRDWQKADADLHKLLGQSPSVVLNHGSSSFSPEQIVDELVKEVDEIVRQGYSHSNGIAPPGQFGSVGDLQDDADWCPGGRAAVADAQDRGTNGAPSDPLSTDTAPSPSTDPNTCEFCSGSTDPGSTSSDSGTATTGGGTG